MKGASIKTFDLSKRFFRTEAVRHLNLTVPERAIYALVGPNGAGKTTAIKLLLNIFRPTSGHARVLEVETANLLPEQLRLIGYVSENQELPGWMTVDYFLSFLRPFYPNWDSERAERMLRQLNIPGDRKLRYLSRGMRMKAALASSLAYRPSLIVLDEPFSGLDALVRDELIERLLEHAEEATIFVSSHDLAEIETFATHVGYLDEGRLLFSEEIESLSARFREIIVTSEVTLQTPPAWPDHWLLPEISSSSVCYIASRYDPEGTEDEIRRLFPRVREISTHAMSLRAIFLALAKSNRSRTLGEGRCD